MLQPLSGWLPLILFSAFCLGFYDLCKKHAVRDNPIMPVLFLATLCGSTFFVLGTIAAGKLGVCVGEDLAGGGELELRLLRNA